MEARSIMFLINALGYGGAELQVFRLALGMKRRGWHVTFVTLIPPVGLADELRAQGIEVLCLNMRRGIPNPIAALKLLRIIRSRAPQIVHSHIVHANLLVRLIRPLAKIPVLICTAHSVNEGRRVFELAYRYSDRLTDLTTNVSQAAVDHYVEIGAAPRHRIRFVPNGLDVSQFRSAPDTRATLRRELNVENKFVWLAAGRLTEAKDCPNMLRAFASLQEENSVLLLAGRGNLEEEVRALAESLKLGERVQFLGLRTDVPALMNCADAYVMSSAWEGMPLVLQEASATGLPVVATEVGGTREVIVRDRSGFLVPRKNSAALTDAMRRVMKMTPTEREEMGAHGRRHVETQFNMDRVLDLWEEIYAQLLRAKQIGLAPASTSPAPGLTQASCG